MSDLIPSEHDSEIALSAIDRSLTDMTRYMLFRNGDSILEMARREGLKPENIARSVRAGHAMYEAEQQMKLRDARIEGALENEKIRENLRYGLSQKIMNALTWMLTGKMEETEIDPVTGNKKVIREWVDPEIISKGLEHARKLTSLEEKPMPSQTVVNIQQNNVGSDVVGGGGNSYEERLERIRRMQDGQPVTPAPEVPMSRRIIETTAQEVQEDTPKKGEEWQF